MNEHSNGIKIIAGNASKKLAHDIAEKLNLPIIDSKATKFSDGETNFSLNESVRGSDVFVVQSTSYPANDNLMELLITLDSLKRASAGRITVIMPYYGYARQDRKAKSRDPITAKLVANLLTEAGADRVITMDLHADQIQGFFDIPVDHLAGGSKLAQYFDNEGLEDLVIVSPDAGSVKRTRKLAQQLRCPFAIIDKERPAANESKVTAVVGDVKDKNCIIIDDMIDTGGTIVNAANALIEHGAQSVRAGCTHGVLSGNAIKKIEESPLEEFVCLDTIEIPEEKKVGKITQLSTADMFAQAIENTHSEQSITRSMNPETYI